MDLLSSSFMLVLLSFPPILAHIIIKAMLFNITMNIHIAWEMYKLQHYVSFDLNLLQNSRLSKNKYKFYLGPI